MKTLFFGLSFGVALVVSLSPVARADREPEAVLDDAVVSLATTPATSVDAGAADADAGAATYACSLYEGYAATPSCTLPIKAPGILLPMSGSYATITAAAQASRRIERLTPRIQSW